MSVPASSRSSAGPEHGRLLFRGTVYAVALLAVAAVGVTLILVALDGHPVGLLTVPAGAVVPVILWSALKLRRSTHDLLQRRRYLLRLLQELPAGAIVYESGTGSAGLTITLLPGARRTTDDIYLTAEPKVDDKLSTAPSEILSELLTNQTEAASLLAEASHHRALAVSSAANVARELTAARAAHDAYEELVHRLDADGRHPVHFRTGLLILAVLGAGLTVLDTLELSALVPEAYSVFPALAVTAAWLALAWLAAIAGRERRRGLVAASGAGAVLLALLLAVLHGANPRLGWSAALERFHGRPFLGVLIGIFIVALYVGAAVLIAHLEPGSLFAARRRWYRARAGYDAAVQVQAADAEAASVSAEAWLDLVRRQASAAADNDEYVIQETNALAEALLESGRVVAA